MWYPLRNLSMIAPLAVLHFAAYAVLNRYPVFPCRRLPLTIIDEAIPFWPATAYPYLLINVAAIVLPLLVRDVRVFRRLIAAYAIAMGTAALFFLLLPTCYPRPPVPPTDLGSAAYLWLISVDTPRCCFPSAHILVPTLACAALWRDGRRGGVALPLAIGACLLTILTTKQHYLWDLFGGLAVAAIGWYLTRRMTPRNDACCK